MLDHKNAIWSEMGLLESDKNMGSLAHQWVLNVCVQSWMSGTVWKQGLDREGGLLSMTFMVNLFRWLFLCVLLHGSHKVSSFVSNPNPFCHISALETVKHRLIPLKPRGRVNYFSFDLCMMGYVWWAVYDGSSQQKR